MLNVSSLSISFTTRNGKEQAVKDVSFSVKAGQTLGIVGESGSGKSVTCYSLLQLIKCPPGQIENGEAEFHQRDLISASAREIRSIRGDKISIVFQDPMTSLNPFMSIGAQIIESLRLHQDIDKQQAREKAIRVLEEVGIRYPEQRLSSYPHEFSGGMRQRVMIAMALVTEPEIIIADEPTTALDVTIQAQILTLLKTIQKTHNIGIIFISHDLAVVKDFADEVLVMKKGEVVERGPARDVFERPQHEYTQSLVASVPRGQKAPKDQKVPKGQKARTTQGAPSDTNHKVLLDIRNLQKTYTLGAGSLWSADAKTVKALDNVSLTLHSREILGLVGESGSGKSTLGRSVMQLVQAESGEILYGDHNLLALSKSERFALRRSIQMIFQDPYASLNPRMTIFDTIGEPLLLHKIATKAELSTKVASLLDDVGLPSAAAKKYPHEFSGGQRQRVAIARAIASEPNIIIADEPVSALDVTIQAQILKLLTELTDERGMSMLFISHDMAVVREICDRVAVMQRGRIVEMGTGAEIFNAAQHAYTQALLSAVPSL